MLVLSRKAGESFIISDSIKITIVSSCNDRVSVGIDAPSDIKVVREELIDTIQTNKASLNSLESEDYKALIKYLKISKNV